MNRKNHKVKKNRIKSVLLDETAYLLLRDADKNSQDKFNLSAFVNDAVKKRFMNKNIKEQLMILKVLNLQDEMKVNEERLEQEIRLAASDLGAYQERLSALKKSQHAAHKKFFEAQP